MGLCFRDSSVFGGAPVTAHAQMLVKFGGWFLFFSAPPLGLLQLGVCGNGAREWAGSLGFFVNPGCRSGWWR